MVYTLSNSVRLACGELGVLGAVLTANTGPDTGGRRRHSTECPKKRIIGEKQKLIKENNDE
jgi:hypothetical protein